MDLLWGIACKVTGTSKCYSLSSKYMFRKMYEVGIIKIWKSRSELKNLRSQASDMWGKERMNIPGQAKKKLIFLPSLLSVDPIELIHTENVLFSLFSLLIKRFSLPETLSKHTRNNIAIFCKFSGDPLIQWSWHIKLDIKIVYVYAEFSS